MLWWFAEGEQPVQSCVHERRDVCMLGVRPALNQTWMSVCSTFIESMAIKESRRVSWVFSILIIMRAATLLTYLFFFFLSFFALVAALPAEPDNGAPAVARDLTGVFDRVLDTRDTANLPKTNDTTDSTEGKAVAGGDDNRAACPWGYGYCSSTGVCCPLGGWCCSNRRCCARG
jgi:hypothetical protein